MRMNRSDIIISSHLYMTCSEISIKVRCHWHGQHFKVIEDRVCCSVDSIRYYVIVLIKLKCAKGSWGRCDGGNQPLTVLDVNHEFINFGSIQKSFATQKK